MDAILNDYSIDNQFNTIDEFRESLRITTLPLLKLLVKYKTNLYKSTVIFDKYICNNVTLSDALFSPNTNSDEATYLKSLLSNLLLYEPFLETESRTDINAIYSVDGIPTFYEEQCNCFSEAYERKIPILSFEHQDFKTSPINITKDTESGEIKNFYNKLSVRDHLLEHCNLTLAGYLQCMNYTKKVVFYKQNNRYSTDIEFDNKKLTAQDITYIGSHFKNIQDILSLGNANSTTTDSVDHKQIKYYEFKCRLSDNRKFRIYYFSHEDRLIYFNSYLKRDTLPKHIKDKTVMLIKEFLKNPKNTR